MAEKRITIVGNAPLSIDYSDLVDSSDVVIRINNCKNYSAFSGKKTDYLFINNFGSPAQGYVENTSLLKNEICKKAERFFFVRNFDCHLEHLKKIGKVKLEKLLLTDYADQIVLSNRIDPEKLELLSHEFNTYVFDTINNFKINIVFHYLFYTKKHSITSSIKNLLKIFIFKERFTMPSTGVFAVLYAINEISKDGDELNLIGFTFEGWRGHGWEIERALIQELAKLGKLNLHY